MESGWGYLDVHGLLVGLELAPCKPKGIKRQSDQIGAEPAGKSRRRNRRMDWLVLLTLGGLVLLGVPLARRLGFLAVAATHDAGLLLSSARAEEGAGWIWFAPASRGRRVGVVSGLIEATGGGGDEEGRCSWALGAADSSLVCPWTPVHDLDRPFGPPSGNPGPFCKKQVAFFSSFFFAREKQVAFGRARGPPPPLSLCFSSPP